MMDEAKKTESQVDTKKAVEPATELKVPECTLEHIINFVLNLFDTDYALKPLVVPSSEANNPIYACSALAINSRRLFQRKFLEQHARDTASEHLLAHAADFVLTPEFLSSIAFEAFTRSRLV